MRAIIFDEFGGPEVLQIRDLPDPTPGPGEVLVKVAATTVNPTDIMMRNGAQAAMMQGLEPPFIAGMEFSGTIRDAGTSGLQVGQPVIGVLNPRTARGRILRGSDRGFGKIGGGSVPGRRSRGRSHRADERAHRSTLA